MNIYFIIAILLANIISIAIVYQFIKKLEKKQILIFIAISVALMYILISIIYWISGFGIEESIHEAIKSFVLYLFVPVNVILCVPYFAFQYMKLRQKQLKVESFARKIAGLLALLILILVIEYFYFHNIQINITNLNGTRNEVQNEVENTPIEENTTLYNENLQANELE